MDDEQQRTLHITLNRSAAMANPPYITKIPRRMAQPDVPHPPRPAPRSPQGNLRLALDIGRELGHGRVGRVYEAEIDLSVSSPNVEKLILPPLVVKISRRGMASALLPEAQTYNDMEVLQGAVIPRVYGLFTGILSDDTHFIPWDEEDLNDDESTPDHYRNLNLMKDVLPPDSVSVIVMERLGGHIPKGQYAQSDLYVVKLSSSASCLMLFDPCSDEMYAMYKDIASMGIYHIDVRYGNILLAPESSPLTARNSPNWGKPYRFRIIDFHKAVRTNVIIETAALDQCNAIFALLSGLNCNLRVEPWDDHI